MTPDTLPVVVALGSNLGDSNALIREALRRLQNLAGPGFQASSVWRTEPVDCPPGSPPFLNAVALFPPPPPPHHTPENLLELLQAWERELGRRPKTVFNEPRTLDLDLIGFGSETRSTPTLVLPHPRAHLRRFVLGPLVELAPDLVLPGWNASARILLQRLAP